MIRRALCVALFTLVPALCAVHATEVPPVCQAHSTALLDALARQDYAHAGTDFDAAVAQALGPDRLQAVWEQQGQFGRYRAHGAPEARTLGGQPMVVTRVTFANEDLDALVACDADGRINTFRLVPAPPAPTAHRSEHV